MKNSCSVCGNDTNMLTRTKLSNGVACADCIKKALQYNKTLATNTRSISVDGLKSHIERAESNVALLANFNPTKKIGKFIHFDMPKKQWLIPSGMFSDTKKSLVRNFSEIQEYELLEDGDTVSSGGLGRAVVGGVLFGGLGAVVGGVTGKKKGKSRVSSVQIKITTRDLENPIIMISLYKGANIKTNSFTYKDIEKKAQEILSTLAIIVSEAKETKEAGSSDGGGIAAELRELNELVGEGILTKEEFEKRKKDLLG